jgi:NADH-quinone oxidoreductase subunit L
MPLTYICFLTGALALSAVPPFAGFFSKDLIIDTVSESHITGSTYAYICVTLGAFITPLYIFRAFFMTFHGEEKFTEKTRAHLRESSWVVLIPLIVLAVPSLSAGWYLMKPLVLDNGFGSSIFVLPQHNVVNTVEFNTASEMIWASLQHSYALYISLAGIMTAWLFYRVFPRWPGLLSRKFSFIYKILLSKYGFDRFNEKVLVRGTRYLSEVFFKTGDLKIVDDTFVNGSGRVVAGMSRMARRLQSGHLYHYALLMITGLMILLCWMVLR